MKVPGLLTKLCYLANIFEKLNDLNISMQGENSNVLTLKDKVNGFLKKLQLWISLGESSKFIVFPCLNNFTENQEMDIEQCFSTFLALVPLKIL